MAAGSDGAGGYIDQWNAGLAAAVSLLGESGFPAALERALRQLVSFEMMNGFAYAPGGKAFDLDNERIVGDRTTIVDHYLAGAYILDPSTMPSAIRRPAACSSCANSRPTASPRRNITAATTRRRALSTRSASC
ncbi:hypothetical protein [Shinella fusca]|uniref:Uncharacterized protein n=1 Tax=Shinella fusca TaxID=544480 RepID=A0A7W7YSQ1_9HYPH|nr:hypothetical protein [Shinella fusca]MBB5041445.1 hypothetical protein [Shinella fusca]